MTAIAGSVRARAVYHVVSPSSPPTPNPFANMKWYIDPDSNARRQAELWRSPRPADADQMMKIADQPHASWFNDWVGFKDIRQSVDDRVSRITAAGALPVLVAYNIPLRDCGSHSGGGAKDAPAYRDWIRSFAEGIGSRKAAVILEPDALAGMDCLSAPRQDERVSLIRGAVEELESRPGVSVYLDAGNSPWHPVAEIVRRLAGAGVARAQGFSLNVSNFMTTESEKVYGKKISQQVGGKHFVIDTSRNGLGPIRRPDDNFEWCNPPGRALGERPTAATGEPLLDAFFWIKLPGESDGECNGGPQAGVWWPEYALGLARRAAW